MARRGWRTREFGDQGWRAREFGDQGWRSREFGDQGWRSRELGDQGADKERVETCRAEQECHVGITGLHRTLDSPLNFGPGEEVPHLGSGAAHRRARRITGISGTAAVGRASVGSGT